MHANTDAMLTLSVHHTISISLEFWRSVQAEIHDGGSYSGQWRVLGSEPTANLPVLRRQENINAK
jgi:hypothetical protein